MNAARATTGNTNADVVGDIGVAERSPAATPESIQGDGAEATMPVLGTAVLAAADRIAELEAQNRRLSDALAGVNRLAAVQGEDLLELGRLARTANEGYSAWLAEQERYKAAVERMRLSTFEVDGIDPSAIAEAKRAEDAAVAAYDRRNAAIVEILQHVGVLTIPHGLRGCGR